MTQVFADPTALRDLAADLARARDQLAALVRRAQSLGAGDCLTGVAGLPGWAGERIDVLVRSATVVESMEAERIDWADALAPGSDLMKAARELGYLPLSPLPHEGHLPGLQEVLDGLPADAGAPRRAEAVAAWWAQLTPIEQVAVVAQGPDLIGNLDGIPYGARDQVNRIRLTRAHAALAADLPFAAPGVDPLAPGALTPDRVSLPDHIWEKIETIQQLEATLSLPDRHLVTLDLDSDPQPKAAIAVGDMDSAANIAVFTPGFTTTVAGSMLDYSIRMNSLNEQARRQTKRAGHDSDFALVAWLGYDAPQMTEVANPRRSVALSMAAANGAESLNSFYVGIAAARPDQPHVTALGHSYGSLTTSLALQKDKTGVDDVVLFGSPGLGTDDVRDLHVPTGHVFVIEARRDAVADLAGFGPDPNQMAGVTDLASHKAMTPDGPKQESVGHSAYLTDNSTSQFNIASVVAGLPDQAVRGGQFGVGDALNYGPTKVNQWLR